MVVEKPVEIEKVVKAVAGNMRRTKWALQRVPSDRT